MFDIVMAIITVASVFFAFSERNKRIKGEKKMEELKKKAALMYEDLKKHATDEAMKWAYVLG
jgi:hypothetical protein